MKVWLGDRRQYLKILPKYLAGYCNQDNWAAMIVIIHYPPSPQPMFKEPLLKEMCWMPPQGSDGANVLHLRTCHQDRWQPYTAFPHYAVPDYPIPGGSKGWATYQALRQAGWKLVPAPPSESFWNAA